MLRLVNQSAMCAKPIAFSALKAGFCRTFTSQMTTSSSTEIPMAQNNSRSYGSFKSFKEYRDFANKSGNMASIEGHCVIDTASENFNQSYWKPFNDAAKKNDYNLE